MDVTVSLLLFFFCVQSHFIPRAQPTRLLLSERTEGRLRCNHAFSLTTLQDSRLVKMVFERFSPNCRKTNSEVVTPTNQDRGETAQ